MTFRSFLVVASAAVAVGACAFVDPVDSRFDTIGRSLAKARNEAIFLNLMRASRSDPLDFVTIANVTPTLTNTTSLGLPLFGIGPPFCGPFATGGAFTCSFPAGVPGRDTVLNNNVASNATAVSTNFSVSTQETSTFYQGFLKPVDLQVINYFIRQNYSRELLFWLFVDSVEVDLGARKFGSRYDPGKDYGCNPRGRDQRERCFAEFVLMAIGKGLTIEEKTVQKPGGGQSKSDSSGSGTNSSKPETTVYGRLCFNSILAEHAQAEMAKAGKPWIEFEAKFVDVKTGFNPQCGSAWDPIKEALSPQPDYFPFHVGQITFRIVPRSAYGVFEFLGKLIKLQQQGEVGLTRNRPFIPLERFGEEAQPPQLWTEHEDPHLITVVPAGATFCFVHTWYDGGEYCVPDEAQTTKEIFSLLAQLIAIQTSATDLSITPLVRVIQ